LTTATPDQFGTGEKAEMKAHFIGQLIGFDFSESEYIKGLIDDEKQISDRALLYAAQFFSAVAKRFPIVFYLDDLHWADNESLNFFDFIAQKCVDEPILITEFTRPILFEKRPHWGEGQDNRVRLNLRPLTKRESHKLVRSILQKAEAIPKTLLDLLVSSTEGNPFYVEELIKMFIEVKVIKTTQDKWVVDTNRLGEITVPPTLTGVLQSRLDKLSNWEKRVLQRASIIGREFWENSLGEFDEEVNLRTILESLRKKELLFRKESSAFADTTEYIFKHALLRDVTYETVLLEERQKWHSETAEWLIRTVTDRENEYLAVIAEHFEKAKDSEKSAIWFGKAGGQALKIYALEIAESYFRKALAFGDFVSKHEPPSILTPQTVMKWKHRLGKVLFEQARFSEAIEIFEDVLETAIGLDDKLGQAYAYWGLSFSQFDLGEIRSSLVSSKEVIRVVKDNDLAKSEEGSFLLSTGLYRQGRALLSLGKFDEVISIAEKILEITNSSEYSDSSVKANGFHLLASANLFLGRFKEAQKYEKQEVEISREIDDKRTIGNGLNSLGFQSYMQGDGKEAIRYYEEAYEIATEIGNQTGAIMVKSNIGGAKVYLGDYQSAESELKKIIAEVGDHGHFLVPEMYRFLTESLIGQGKFKEALETAKKSLTLSEESESREMIGEAWRVLGISLSCLKQDTLVSDKKISPEDCFRKSLTIFEEIGMEANYAQVLDNFASHKLSVGETEKAGELAAREQEISNRLDINTKAKNKYFNNLKN
jgi:tetratricopeptide (TPR) repeat protein